MKPADAPEILKIPIGINASGDPLSEVRSDIYLLSGRRRRAADGK